MKRLEDLDEVELDSLMRTAAHAVEWAFHDQGVEKPLFALVIFNDPKIGQYIGNCRREDIIKALRETAERMARNQDVRRN